MIRLLAAVGALVAVVGAPSAAATAPVNFLVPLPAAPSTARLAVATGSGEERLAIWTARNASRELCVGWRAGASKARPSAFTCLRRGLEQPLVAVVHGGGRGNQTTWGAIAGVASPLVGRIEAETLWGTRVVNDVALRDLPGFPGWHAFTSGPLEHPSSTILKAYAADGTVIGGQGGSAIHPPRSFAGLVMPPPPINGQAPPATGPAWRATAASLPRSGAVARQAIPLALADPGVRQILASHQAWLVGMTGWGTCDGRPLGGMVVFQFAAPASFTATLPAVGKASGAAAYSTGVRQIEAAGWTTMNVWVDTNTRTVVGVGPQPYENPSHTETLATVVQPHDAGGPSSGRCAESSGD